MHFFSAFFFLEVKALYKHLCNSKSTLKAKNQHLEKLLLLIFLHLMKLVLPREQAQLILMDQWIFSGCSNANLFGHLRLPWWINNPMCQLSVLEITISDLSTVFIAASKTVVLMLQLTGYSLLIMTGLGYWPQHGQKCDNQPLRYTIVYSEASARQLAEHQS